MASIGDAVTAAVQDPAFDTTALVNGVTESMNAGRLRCAIVIDAAPPDLVELVGYLQDVSNDRLSVDLVTVTAYEVAGGRVLVPQLIEPERTRAVKPPSASPAPVITRGGHVFAEPGSTDVVW